MDERLGDNWSSDVAGSRPKLASVGARLVARVIDGILVFVVTALIWLLAWVADLATPGLSWDRSKDFEVFGWGAGSVIALVPFLVGMAYEVSYIAGRGQTPGKRLAGVLVVDAETGGLPSWSQAFRRWALPAALGLVPVVGWLLATLALVAVLWDRRRQGWHDKVAQTLVVRAP